MASPGRSEKSTTHLARTRAELTAYRAPEVIEARDRFVRRVGPEVLNSGGQNREIVLLSF